MKKVSISEYIKAFRTIAYTWSVISSLPFNYKKLPKIDNICDNAIDYLNKGNVDETKITEYFKKIENRIKGHENKEF